MKKHLNLAPFLAAAAGVAGALLRSWLLKAGTDDRGLYPSGHPGWIGYVILSVAMIVGLYLLTREAEAAPTWHRNFPNTFPAAGICAAGYALAAVSIFLFGKTSTGSTLIRTIVYWGSFACIGALLFISLQLLLGKKPLPGVFPIPCIYFAALMFLESQQFRGEPELLRYLPQVAALACCTLASYQLWGFAADCGNRKTSLFWSCCAIYFCLAAAPGNTLLYPLVGLWQLLSHCAAILPPVEAPAEAKTEIFEEAVPSFSDETPSDEEEA